MFRLPAIAASLLLATIAVSAQDARPAEEVYKNIRVLKGVPANQILESMHFIKAALGVECEHCHVPMHMDSDEKPMKLKARAMYQMMNEINRASFGGRQLVTCYTCHKGHTTPEDLPAMPIPAAEAPVETKAPLPTVDQILAKYVAALGGEQAMRTVTSRVITATQDIPTGPGGSIPVPAKLERSQKAPNLVLDLYAAEKFTVADGFDGTAAWTKAQNGTVTSPAPGGVDAERARRAASLYEPLTLKEQYQTMRVDGMARVNGHDAYLVIGAPATGTPERLYFDEQTGLLLRKWSYVETAPGRVPFQVDFEDYRNTNSGVKIPFTIRMAPAGPRMELQTTSTLRVTNVKDNVPLDDGKFVKPSPAR
ncbi:MAG: c-type cytochrome [Acidobacteria bacterium]|nr:MAG: c-type cytochrome [Acidobacteriota bacterium]